MQFIEKNCGERKRETVCLSENRDEGEQRRGGKQGKENGQVRYKQRNERVVVGWEWEGKRQRRVKEKLRILDCIAAPTQS